MNPFEETPMSVEDALQNWRELYPCPYNKFETDPYTKARIILMNGTEVEANFFSHQFSRHVTDNDLRRELALTRFIEKQQQIKISLLKPANESILEHTIAYEQLAVDLTAELARRETDCYVKNTLDFALLEDFDHLYRFSDLLIMEQGVCGEKLVGGYTEIMPGRPTIAHHRFPTDNVRRFVSAKTSDLQTVLNSLIITAAEQQTMNYYMNVTNFTKSDIARRVYEEIALVEEEHVTQYEDLIDPTSTWLEMLLLHEYNECYLYWSCYVTETHPYVKRLWEENLAFEISHLHKAASLLERYENKSWQQVITNGGEFPAPISLHENIGYVRGVLANTVQFTSVGEDYVRVEALPADSEFFRYQSLVNPTPDINPAHNLIEGIICKRGCDYRYEVAPDPVPTLQCRREDNVSVGRVHDAAPSTDFSCNT